MVKFHGSIVLRAFLEAEYVLYSRIGLVNLQQALHLGGWQSVLALRDALNNRGGEVRGYLEASVDQFDWNRGFEEKSERKY